MNEFFEKYFHLETIEVNTSSLNIEKSFQELVCLQERKAEPGCPWGFFPGLEKGQGELYAESIQLANQLKDLSFADNRILAFIRASNGAVTAGFGGLHLDIDIEVTHPRDPILLPDIERVLINLYDKPRELHYAEITRDELIERGFSIPENRYQVLELPCEIKTQSIFIPARTENSLSFLRFLGNHIPHVGVTGDEGHFLASYGRYI